MNRPTSETLGRLAFLANTRGIIPNPVNATRVAVAKNALGVAVTILYTVPTGKVFFLTNVYLGSRESANADSNVDVSVRNSADSYLYTCLRHWYDIAGHQASAEQFIPALEISAGCDVYVETTHANTDGTAFICGWLEDV